VFTTWMVEAAAIAGAEGTSNDAMIPANAVHTSRRDRDFMRITSE
jgi:hypothetical protein